VCVGKGVPSTAPWERKNAKCGQVDGDIPAEEGTARSVVVDGQVPTAVVDIDGTITSIHMYIQCKYDSTIRYISNSM
jgi:hypothetical protein